MGQSGGYTDYLDSLIGKAGDTSHLDSLVGATGAGGYGAYLDKLLAGASPDVAGASPDVAIANSAETLSPEEQARRTRDGNYGTRSSLSGVDVTDVDSVAKMALSGGWADPNAFNLDMLEPVLSWSRGFGHGGNVDFAADDVAHYRFKPEHAAARGMGPEYSGGNFVNRTFTTPIYDESETGGASPIGTSGVDGYRVKAGMLQGEKRPTTIYYQYDKDGKFKGAEFDVKESTLSQMAPLITLATMAFGMPMATAAGGAVNAGLNLGLGATGKAVLGGALVGGGKAALTGQNIGKGMVTGAAGAGINALNPAGAMDFTNPVAVKAINGAISGATGAAINGQNVLTGAVAGGATGAIGGYDPAKQLGITNPTLHNVVNGAIQGGARGLITGQSPAEQAVLGGLEGLAPPRKR